MPEQPDDSRLLSDEVSFGLGGRDSEPSLGGTPDEVASMLLWERPR